MVRRDIYFIIKVHTEIDPPLKLQNTYIIYLYVVTTEYEMYQNFICFGYINFYIL